jgi:hypothetical protein
LDGYCQQLVIGVEVMPNEAKGGTFAPADMELLKRALHYYKDMRTRIEESERSLSPELTQVANLLHRIGRIA